jgi:hypothetical protein
VVGARRAEKSTHRLLRTFAKESVKALASYLVGKPIPDLNSGLRAFNDVVGFPRQQLKCCSNEAMEPL